MRPLPIARLLAFGFLILAPCLSFPCDKKLTDLELNAIARQIYLNECNGQSACLVDWNPGESFPSLGIGHFIWYPFGVNPGYVESFPLLIDFLRQQKIALPDWLTHLQPFAAPWPDRAHFLTLRDSAEVNELRHFLLHSQAQQIAFMQQRMRFSLQSILLRLPTTQIPDVQHSINLLCQSLAGQYALIDYVNFKGEGLAEGERLRGEGWGLMQVLSQMPRSETPPDAIAQFALAADKVLTRRALNSPNPELQQQWLKGWRKRIQTYVRFQLP